MLGVFGFNLLQGVLLGSDSETQTNKLLGKHFRLRNSCYHVLLAATVEKSSSAEDTTEEVTKAEPEPVYIDEVCGCFQLVQSLIRYYFLEEAIEF